MSDMLLKPCPHCNGRAETHYEDGMFCVTCIDCFMRGPEIPEVRPEAEKDAIAVWNKLPRAMQWTRETPTENGWYIYQERRNRRLCCVIDGKVTGFAFGLWKVEDLHGEWSGPLSEPEEQK